MKAMVFAAGIGSRLKEFTKDRPKCLVSLGDGTTMLDRVIGRLKQAGVDAVVINLFHHSDQVEAHVRKQQSYGIRVEFSREQKLLGTGGGLKQAAWFFDSDEPFFVHNSDVYTDFNLTELVRTRKHQNAMAALAVMERPTSRHLLFDGDKKLIGWENAGTDAVVIRECAAPWKVGFSGIQILTRKIFGHMSGLEGDFSIISAYLNAAKAGETVLGFDMGSAYWLDMGTPEKLETLKQRLKG